MKPQKTKLRDFLEDKIPKELIEKVNRSFEVVGDIAITEIPEELIQFEKDIGEAIMQTNKSVKVVLKKKGIHEGEFRTQELTNIAGENRKETIYTENNIKLKINPEEVYFSAKLSTEREELMKNIDDDSRVLIMFSGCGPYSYVGLRKNPDVARITSIEINPQGHKYALDSLELNKNIIKKSIIYDDLIGFLSVNKVKIIEKILCKNLNYLKLNFINADVKKEAENLRLKPIQKEMLEDDNKLFSNNQPEYIVKQLHENQNKTLFFNFDKLKDFEDLTPYLILFAQKFNFEIIINGEYFVFDSQYKKALLLNYLEFEGKTPIEEIGEFDEIFMPLPKDAKLFLDSAFKVSAPNATIHMYDFVHESEFPTKTENEVYEAAKKFGYDIEILQTRKVGQYAPGKYRVCCDFTVKKF